MMLVFDLGFSIGVWSVGKGGLNPPPPPPIAGGICKILVKWEGGLRFLPGADFHGHELQVLVKICITGRKIFEIP